MSSVVEWDQRKDDTDRCARKTNLPRFGWGRIMTSVESRSEAAIPTSSARISLPFVLFLFLSPWVGVERVNRQCRTLGLRPGTRRWPPSWQNPMRGFGGTARSVDSTVRSRWIRSPP